jgi:hypothetical protein
MYWKSYCCLCIRTESGGFLYGGFPTPFKGIHIPISSFICVARIGKIGCAFNWITYKLNKLNKKTTLFSSTWHERYTYLSDLRNGKLTVFSHSNLCTRASVFLSQMIISSLQDADITYSLLGPKKLTSLSIKRRWQYDTKY